jgi:hypothetical protein
MSDAEVHRLFFLRLNFLTFSFLEKPEIGRSPLSGYGLNKRAVEMVPISKDAMDGPGLLANLAVVYAWTGESDQAWRATVTFGRWGEIIVAGHKRLRRWCP